MNKYIPFNKPFVCGRELTYMAEALKGAKLSGGGYFSDKCKELLDQHFDFSDCILTPSCTSALELAALTLDIQKGDEVILPSYTFVSTANAFILRGATLKFADSMPERPHMDPRSIESLITSKTKVVVVVHYAGIACNMEEIMALCQKNNISLIEDAAPALGGHYKGKPLGSFGKMAAFSFHETKNIGCGEGGLLVINDKSLIKKAEIISEKGTDKAAFLRGETSKYSWKAIGGSYKLSEISAAFLLAQLENLKVINQKRLDLWNQYNELLQPWAQKGAFEIPPIPSFSSNNAHSFYLICNNGDQRNALIDHLLKNNVLAVFHYLSLHKSPFCKDAYQDVHLPQSDRFSDALVRLPLFYELTSKEVDYIAGLIGQFYTSHLK